MHRGGRGPRHRMTIGGGCLGALQGDVYIDVPIFAAKGVFVQWTEASFVLLQACPAENSVL